VLISWSGNQEKRGVVLRGKEEKKQPPERVFQFPMFVKKRKGKKASSEGKRNIPFQTKRGVYPSPLTQIKREGERMKFQHVSSLILTY